MWRRQAAGRARRRLAAVHGLCALVRRSPPASCTCDGCAHIARRHDAVVMQQAQLALEHADGVRRKRRRAARTISAHCSATAPRRCLLSSRVGDTDAAQHAHADEEAAGLAPSRAARMPATLPPAVPSSCSTQQLALLHSDGPRARRAPHASCREGLSAPRTSHATYRGDVQGGPRHPAQPRRRSTPSSP